MHRVAIPRRAEVLAEALKGVQERYASYWVFTRDDRWELRSSFKPWSGSRSAAWSPRREAVRANRLPTKVRRHSY
jgi:hypothetical protein